MVHDAVHLFLAPRKDSNGSGISIKPAESLSPAGRWAAAVNSQRLGVSSRPLIGSAAVAALFFMNTPFVQVEQKKGYAIISLKRDPVNSMNLDLWKQLTSEVQKCENDPTIRGVIFTSGLTRQIFGKNFFGQKLDKPWTNRTKLVLNKSNLIYSSKLGFPSNSNS